jgi:hypothetical protein
MVILPHPTDANKSILAKLDKASMKFMPEFALKMVAKNKLVPNVTLMVTKFKQSETYKSMQ